MPPIDIDQCINTFLSWLIKPCILLLLLIFLSRNDFKVHTNDKENPWRSINIDDLYNYRRMVYSEDLDQDIKEFIKEMICQE